jgi:leader peptidase (prepilin peptidase)/N-methyltransferase
MMAVRGQDRSVPFAFGPYLAIAMWIWLVAGQPILGVYLHLTGLQ